MTSPEALKEDFMRVAKTPTLAMMAPAIKDSMTAYSIDVAASLANTNRRVRENAVFFSLVFISSISFPRNIPWFVSHFFGW